MFLQNRGRMTSRELAAHLEVSERTIHRDMEALSATGIPVIAERGTNGGWMLLEGYRTNLTGMKTEEMQTLLLAHSSTLLSDLGLGGVFEDAFQKLLAAFPATMRRDANIVRQRIHVDGAGWHPTDDQLLALPIVQEAIWADKKLSIQYRRDDKLVDRVVEPLGLVAKSSVWYLIAITDGDIRTYRISRIVTALMADESFNRPESFDLAKYWEQSTKDFQASLPQYSSKIRFSEQVLSRLSQQRYMKLQQMERVVDHWIEAKVEFHTLDSACEILLGFGSQVEVVEPIELRDRIIAEVSAIQLLYN